MDHAAEKQLVALSRQGDSAAIGELFDLYYKPSLNIARRILASKAESEDAVQSAFCSAFQHIDSFREDASFGTWVHRIVVNRCLMTIREPWRRMALASARRPETPGDGNTMDWVVSSAPSPEKSAWCRQLSDAHNEAMLALPEKIRAA